MTIFVGCLLGINLKAASSEMWNMPFYPLLVENQFEHFGPPVKLVS